MAFIETVAPAEATGDVHTMYAGCQGSMGYVPNYAQVFCHRPGVMSAWTTLMLSIRGNLDLRRYELVTLATARALRSSYCSLAHGSILRDKFYDAEQLVAIADDYIAADLAPLDVAIMAYAEKIVRDAASVTEADIQHLRELGLSDPEIFDVAAAAAARCFFSKLLDALGAEPDSAYTRLEPAVLERLTVGRAVSQAAVEPLDTTPPAQ